MFLLPGGEGQDEGGPTDDSSGARMCPVRRGISRSTPEHQDVLNYSNVHHVAKLLRLVEYDTVALHFLRTLMPFRHSAKNVSRSPSSRPFPPERRRIRCILTLIPFRAG